VSPVRILLVDDQDLVRGGFRVILESEPGLEVVGEARTGAEAVAAAASLRPDVVCMDVQMPVMDGLEATRRIVAAGGPPVLVLTTFDRDDYLFEALQAGASGFLLKNASPEKLVEAVQVVAAGDALLAPDVTRRVIERFGDMPAPAPSSPLLATLTERETEVLGLLARGSSNAEIAAALFLGEATVKTHVSNVLVKLGVRDRIHAVVFAYEHGIAVPGSPS
jgi:DNA-binding NarL/FixJ family response regulator